MSRIFRHLGFIPFSFGLIAMISVSMCYSQAHDSLNVRKDSVRRVASDSTREPRLSGLSPTTLTLQFLGGEATMAAFYFGLGGNGLLIKNPTNEQEYIGAWAWWAGLFASSGAVDIVGNLMYARHGSYWHTLVGGVAGLVLVPIFSYDSTSLFHRSSTFKYVIISTLPVLGEVAMYYLWPSSPDPPESTNKFQVAPFALPQGGGIGLRYHF